MPSRRTILAALVAAARRARMPRRPLGTPRPRRPRPAPLRFPRDFGAHPEARTEWWYVTGALAAGERAWGFQITFFRAATGVAGADASRFAARQLLFAHGAVTDLAARRLRHDQRIARSGFGIAEAARRRHRARPARLAPRRAAAAPARAAMRRVRRATAPASPSTSSSRRRSRSCCKARTASRARARGASRSSRYYSEPQLDVRGTLADRRADRPRSPAAPGSTTSGATPTSTRARSAGTGSA